MKALCYHGKYDVRVEDVPEPQIENPRDAIIKVTSTAICGSDLHLFHGLVPTMKKGDILGHEFMGEVVEVGAEVKKLKAGDRVIVPFCIGCGTCRYCEREQWTLCDNSNPNAAMLEKMYGFGGGGLFGYSHLYGGYPGGQAEFVRVPFADVGPFKIPADLTDEQVLFLTDILPTGYQAAVNCDIKPGSVVAVWGCGPVGQFAIRSAWVLGAERVIAIDDNAERLQLAAAAGTAMGRTETLDFSTQEIFQSLRDMTAGRGPDACIDAVGMEAHGSGFLNAMDATMQTLKIEMDRPVVLREAIQACGKGGTVSIPGVYTAFIDRVPFGAAFAKGLTFKMGQTNVHKFLPELLEHIQAGRLHPEEVITHRLTLAQAAEGYKTFSDKADNCIKVVLKP